MVAAGSLVNRSPTNGRKAWIACCEQKVYPDVCPSGYIDPQISPDHQINFWRPVNPHTGNRHFTRSDFLLTLMPFGQKKEADKMAALIKI